MTDPVPDATLDQMFRDARTYNQFKDTDVPETLIRSVYELTKFGPTSANCSPARFVFVQSDDARKKLEPHLAEGNREKTLKAPWIVIIAFDEDFAEKIPELFPHNPGAKDWFSDPDVAHETAFRNGTLQGAYLIMAARSLGLDCGPMSGFDKAGVNKAFFSGDGDTGKWKANFLCNIGYGDASDLFPRSPRLGFDTACRIV